MILNIFMKEEGTEVCLKKRNLFTDPL